MGGCERIDNTSSPFSLIGSSGNLAPLLSVFVACPFMAIESFAAELEEPFGVGPNDLALGALFIGIENAVHALLGGGIESAFTRSKDFVVL